MEYYKELATISQQRLLSVIDSLRPLQTVLGSRRGAPIIIGGLSMGVLIYCGHRWLSAAKATTEKQQEQQMEKEMELELDADKQNGNWQLPQAEQEAQVAEFATT